MYKIVEVYTGDVLDECPNVEAAGACLHFWELCGKFCFLVFPDGHVL